MTSATQLPVESLPSKTLPQGNTSRGRNNRPGEEDAESGFATVFAQALPEHRRVARPERASETKGTSVEGEAIPAEVQASAVPDVGETAKPGAVAHVVELAAPALIAEAAPAAATGMGWSDPAVAATETLEEPPASVVEGAIEEDLPESEIAASDDLPRPVPSQPLEPLTDVTELKITKARPAPNASEESGRHERPRSAPERADLAAALPVRVQETAAPKAAPEQTKQQPRGPSMLPENKEGPQVPSGENTAEQRRIGVTPAATKTEPPPAAGAPVIEFEVRREAPAQDGRQQSESADWLRAIRSRAETRQEPAPQKDLKQARFRPPEHSDGLHPVARRVAGGPQADLGAGQQPERGGSGDAAEASDEVIERIAQPNPRALNVKSILAKLFNPQPDNERSEQVPLKPLAAATPAVQSAHGQQTAAPAHSVPLAASRDQPPEATRPVAPAIPPGEPVIAAKLHQQSGRTTLNVVLQDERLGRVALQIVERGGWIETAIRASDPRTAQSLSHGAAGLFEALQERGLTLAAGTGASPWDAREGQRRDNAQRDQESQRRRFRLRRGGGEFEGALARAEV